MSTSRWKRVRGAAGLYQLPSGSYFYRFRCKGKVFSGGLGTNREKAKDLLLKKRLDVRRGVAGLLDNDYSLDDLCKQYLGHCERRLRPKTVKDYRLALGNIRKLVTVDWVGQLTPPMIEDYIAARKTPGIANRTLNLDIEALQRALNFGVSQGKIASNPLREVARLPERDKKFRRALSRDEFGALLNHRHGKRACTSAHFWIMLGETGMRLGELAALRWESVDLDRRRILIREGKTPAARRSIPMTNRVATLLAERYQEGAVGLVFTTREGKPVINSLRPKLDHCLTAAEIDRYGICLHSFRYSFASWLIQAGESPKTVQKLLGHASVQLTLRIYAQVLPGDLKRAVQRLDAPAPKLAHAQQVRNGFLRGVG